MRNLKILNDDAEIGHQAFFGCNVQVWPAACQSAMPKAKREKLS